MVDSAQELLQVALGGVGAEVLGPVVQVLEHYHVPPVDIVYELYHLGVDRLVQQGNWRRLRVVARQKELEPNELVLIHHLDQH